MTPDDDSLRAMIEEMRSAPPVFQPSHLWEQLNQQHTGELEASGFENFKRTVNFRFFQFSTFNILVHQFFPMLAYALKTGGATGIRQSLTGSRFDYAFPVATASRRFNAVTARIYELFVLSLYAFTKSIDSKRLLDSIAEPEEGNPYVVESDGKRLTQDLLNSICEFYSAIECFDRPDDIRSVAEIGSGYGRTAYVFLRGLPGCTFTVIDIPVALYMSQRYLSSVCPDDRVFRFRHFESYADIADEFESARIRFLTPNQLELLPDRSFDLVMNISSFHEMNFDQIDYYFGEIDRLCRGMLYLKQWKRSKHYTSSGSVSLATLLTELGIIGNTKYSERTLSPATYPYRPSWVQQYQRTHPVQTLFFESVYKTRG